MIELAVIVLAGTVIIGVCYELAQITLDAAERRHDRRLHETIRRRYGQRP